MELIYLVQGTDHWWALVIVEVSQLMIDTEQKVRNDRKKLRKRICEKIDLNGDAWLSDNPIKVGMWEEEEMKD